MPTTSFTEKILQVSLTLGGGAAFPSGGNTTTVQGLKVTCEVEKGGHPSKNKMKMKIYGMRQDDMNALNTLSFKPLKVRKNILRVLAGDENKLGIAYQGEISEANIVYSSPPNLYLHIEAISGFYPSIAPAPIRSFKGGVSVAGVMSQIAASMGYSFEDNGVQATLSDPYLDGSDYDQAAAVADAADVEFGIDDGTLFVAPKGKPRAGLAPVLSASTGLIEYPTFDKKGIKLKCMYEPSLQLGGLVIVQSEIPQARGTWRIHGLKHHLESLTPNGKWESSISGAPAGG